MRRHVFHRNITQRVKVYTVALRRRLLLRVWCMKPCNFVSINISEKLPATIFRAEDQQRGDFFYRQPLLQKYIDTGILVFSTHPYLASSLKKELSYISTLPLDLHGLFQGELCLYFFYLQTLYFSMSYLIFWSTDGLVTYYIFRSILSNSKRCFLNTISPQYL